MCGRMTLTRRDFSAVAEELAAELDDSVTVLYRPRFNVAPTDPHLVCVSHDDRRRLMFALWGVEGPGGRPLINARAETAATRPTFRDAFARRRCLVPADGFYEWKTTPEGRVPIWFHDPRGKLLLLAGLYEDDVPAGDGTSFVRRFVVLTTAPNRIVREVHDRMPAVLTPEEAQAWLRAPVRDVLHPASDELLIATPVSTRVNSVKNDDPGCLSPPSADAKPAQLPLF